MSDTDRHVYQRFAALLEKSIGLEPGETTPQDTFSGLEMDSLALVELTVAVEEEFGVQLSDDELDADATLADAAGVISGKTVAST